MALKVIKGGVGSGKTQLLLEEIIARSQAEPGGRFLVLVPEQYTNSVQARLLKLHPQRAMLNIDVLSFHRLAQRAFAVCGRQPELLDDVGKTFLVERAALKLKKSKQLMAVGANVTRAGSAVELKTLMTELALYRVTPEKLREAAGDGADGFAVKQRDLALIYETYENEIGKRFTTAEDEPAALARILEKSGLADGAVIALDGFTGFTPAQLPLVKELMRLSSDMLAAVTLPEAFSKKETGAGRTDMSVYGLSLQMLNDLYGLAAELGTAKEEPVQLPDKESRAALSVRFSKNPAAEAEAAGHAVLRLVRDKGLRYRDIAVVAGDFEGSAAGIRQAFTAMGIPHFMDQKRPLVASPVTEFVRAAIGAAEEGMSAASVRRLLASGLFPIERRDAAVISNYITASGISSKKKWKDEFSYSYDSRNKAELPQINEIRKLLFGLVVPFTDRFCKKRATVAERSRALFEFMEACGVGQAAMKRGEMLKAQGKVLEGNIYGQSYERICAIFETFVDILGEERLTAAEYRALTEAAFASEKIGSIPPGNDEVVVADLERSRLSRVKALIFLGLNEGSVPKVDTGAGFLSQADRRRLEDRGIRLKPIGAASLLNGRFYCRTVMEKPEDELILSYSAEDAAGKEISPSFIVGEAVRGYRENAARQGVPCPEIEARVADRELSERLLQKRDAYIFMSEGLAKLESLGGDGGELNALRQAAAQLKGSGEDGHFLNEMLKAARPKTGEARLDLKDAEELYGKRIVLSPSGLEDFAKCPFSYFAKKGLGLKETVEYDFTGADRGSLVHAALEHFSEGFGGDLAAVRDLGGDEIALRVNAAVEEAAKGGSGILTQSPTWRFHKARIKKIVIATVKSMQRKLRVSEFVPRFFEMKFDGAWERDRALRFDLGEGGLHEGAELILRGRLDRMDVAEVKDEAGRTVKTLLKVIDYKTGMKKFSFNGLRYGTQLQLPLYMKAALERYPKGTAEPAAMIYLPAQNPMINYAGLKNSDRRKYERFYDLLEGRFDGGEDGRDKIYRIAAGGAAAEMRGSGIVSSEKYIYESLDTNLKNGEYESVVIPLKLTKKDRIPDANTKALNRGEFDAALNFALEKAKELGREILGGKADTWPANVADSDPCMFCDYKDACRKKLIPEEKLGIKKADTADKDETLFIVAGRKIEAKDDKGGKGGKKQKA